MTDTKTRFYHYMATCQVIYMKNETQKQRTINILLLVEVPVITAKDLRNVNTNAIGRISQENDILPNEVKDVVFLGLSFLGFMSEDEFQSSEEKLPTQTN